MKKGEVDGITFDRTPDPVGLGRIIVDGKHYGIPIKVLDLIAALKDENDGYSAAIDANWVTHQQLVSERKRAEKAEAEVKAYKDAATARDRNEDALKADNERLLSALCDLVEVCPCDNGCAPDDMTCATMKARAAIDAAKGEQK